MKRIFKYHLPPTDMSVVQMPRDAEVVSAHEQSGEIFVWALVNPETAHDMHTRRFRIAGTGHDISESPLLCFIDSVHLLGGRLVFHVFEVL